MPWSNPAAGVFGFIADQLTPLLISTKLPSVVDIQKRIDTLKQQLAAYPATGGSLFVTVQRKALQAALDQQQKALQQAQRPEDQSGVPPAPDKAPILGPRIEAPKVGLNDLKIILPPR